MPLRVFVNMALLPASAFLVFLNYLQTPVLQPPEALPIAPRVARAVRTLTPPRPVDRTTLSPFPASLRTALTLPPGAPRPFPTNAWWSSGALEPWPAPFFPYPLVVTLDATGLVVVDPAVEVSGRAIMHAPKEVLRFTYRGAPLTRSQVLNWGDWDVTWRAYSSQQEAAFDVTVAQGSPFAFVRTHRGDFSVTLPPESRIVPQRCSRPCGESVLITSPTRRYLITVSDGGAIDQQGSALTVIPPVSGLLSIATIAPGSDPQAYLPFALAPPEGTEVSYAVKPETVETTYTAPRETLLGIFPHQAAFLRSSLGESIGTYQTVRGPVTLYRGRAFVTDLPRPPLLPGLPLAQELKGNTRFLTTLRQEIGALLPATQGDIYAAGKQVLRAAQLMEIAHQTGEAALAKDAQGKVHSMLSDWCQGGGEGEERSFAYDERVGGLIGFPPAFGSEHYNDHHFHAGYFLSAGALLALRDPSFAPEYGTCMRLLTRDIAAWDRGDSSFPYLRHFDAYAGHSWANGLTRFNDAQNQESTSEALQAWHAVALLGRSLGDKGMEDVGTWLLAQEAAATRAYWFNALEGHPTLPQNFPFPMVSILWGGKADYATFFDGSDEAVRGIQFFPPTTPALLAVAHPRVIDTLVKPLAVLNPPGMWKTSLTLAAAIGGYPQRIPEGAPLDPVLSKSAVEHWVAAFTELGAYAPQLVPERSCGAAFGKGTSSSAVVFRRETDPAECTFIDARTGKRGRITGLNAGWNVKRLTFP
ncbi:MAG: glycosyl hydrolase [Candidatus Peregrinibacteria bacterium]|nr:glycosyl hydrolase [Candidatus Peregrinibacteria bacterium]